MVPKYRCHETDKINVCIQRKFSSMVNKIIVDVMLKYKFFNENYIGKVVSWVQHGYMQEKQVIESYERVQHSAYLTYECKKPVSKVK